MPKAIPYHQFHSDNERKYLPNYVFGYYSGPSNRMEKPLRPLFYARPVHSQFVLLSFFTEEKEGLAEGEQSLREFLDELLGIQKLVSVLFVMRQPPWNSKEGDSRFWYARGAVSQFLSQWTLNTGNLQPSFLYQMKRRGT